MSIKEYYEQAWTRGTGEDPGANERRRALARIIDAYVPAGSKVLDAGCGNGEFVEFFVNKGHQTHGLDIAQSAIEKARLRCPAAAFHSGSLEQTLSIPSGSFDLIWCAEVLEHLFDVEAAARQMNRLLRKGGHLFLTTPYHGLLKNVAIAMVGFDRHFDALGPHIRFFTRKSLGAILKQGGFKILSWRGIGRCWPFYKSFFVVARKEREL